jgi:hypothetical protein
MDAPVTKMVPPQTPHSSPDGKWWWTGSAWVTTDKPEHNQGPLYRVTKLVWLGLTILVLSSVLLALGWSRTLSTMHQVAGPSTSRIALTKGTYWIYEDPSGDAYFPLQPSSITVRGPNGPLKVTATSYELQPGDIAAPFMGTGLFAPVASLTANISGSYAVTIPLLPYNDKVFVGTTESSALAAVGPWVVGAVTGLVMFVGGLLAHRSRRGERISDA